jgi:hypothetical protein
MVQEILLIYVLKDFKVVKGTNIIFKRKIQVHECESTNYLLNTILSNASHFAVTLYS